MHGADAGEHKRNLHFKVLSAEARKSGLKIADEMHKGSEMRGKYDFFRREW